MNYGDALQLLKAGEKLQRKGWNGAGMYIFMRPGDTVENAYIAKVKTIPQSVKDDFAASGSDMEFLPCLCMFTAQRTIVTGWLASQTDMLAEDWQVF